MALISEACEQQQHLDNRLRELVRAEVARQMRGIFEMLWAELSPTLDEARLHREDAAARLNMVTTRLAAMECLLASPTWGDAE